MSSSARSVLVTGGTGFIGKALVPCLLDLGYSVIVLTRNPQSATPADNLRYIQSLDDVAATEPMHGVINLAGEPLASGRWTTARKKLFVSSRVQVTKEVFKLIERLSSKPEVLISGSAIGWYGPQRDEELPESAAPEHCFSHYLCDAWEEEALHARSLDVRVCLLRIGIVLGAHGGPLTELRRSFLFKVAARLGHGNQWMSWIHVDDLVAMMLFLLEQQAVTGVVNGTAPTPVTNSTFTDTLATLLKPWLRIAVPAKLLSLLVGEMAEEVLLTGQRVIPEKAVNAGFEFSYPQLEQALLQILQSK